MSENLFLSTKSLIEKANKCDMIHVAQLNENDPTRASKYAIDCAGIHFNFAKALVDDEVLGLLEQLSNQNYLIASLCLPMIQK